MLFASVLIAHTALLQSAPAEIVVQTPPPVVFHTRSVPAEVQVAIATPAPEPALEPAQVQPAKAPVRPPAPTPTRILKKPTPHLDNAAQDSNSASNQTVALIETAQAAIKSEAASPHPRTSHATAVHLPDAQRLLYAVNGEVKHFPYNTHAELLWQPSATSYQARLEIAVPFSGARVQTSAGRITDQGLAPERFGDKVKSEVAAHFERDKGIVSFSANTPDVALEPGAQDRLSVLLQLSGLLAGDPKRYAEGSSIALQTIGPRDADTWHFVLGQVEALDLPLAAGPHKARKLSRQPQHEHDLQVELWLAPDQAYLPVQLRLTQANGDFVQLQLKSTEKP